MMKSITSTGRRHCRSGNRLDSSRLRRSSPASVAPSSKRPPVKGRRTGSWVSGSYGRSTPHRASVSRSLAAPSGSRCVYFSGAAVPGRSAQSRAGVGTWLSLWAGDQAGGSEGENKTCESDARRQAPVFLPAHFPPGQPGRRSKFGLPAHGAGLWRRSSTRCPTGAHRRRSVRRHRQCFPASGPRCCGPSGTWRRSSGAASPSA